MDEQLECAVAGRALEGEAESGDGHVVVAAPRGYLLAVVDGLGHGPEAASATEMALAVLREHAGEALPALVERCHRALVGSRGVVMTLAALDLHAGALSWLAVGNVEGRLFRHAPGDGRLTEAVLLRGGVVGDRLPRLRPVSTALAPGDTIVLVTDGIRPNFEAAQVGGGPAGTVARRILDGHAIDADDALVLVARVRSPGADPA